MPNRFDTPAQHRFINSYTPIPFSELAAAGQARQGRFDENAARIDAAQVAVDQMQAIPNSADQAKVEQWRTQMGEFADEFIDKDISDPEVYRKIKTGIRSIVNPNELSAIGQSHQGYLAYQKVASQMQSRGEQVYNPQDFAGYSSLDTGIFTGQPTMDLGAHAEKAIKDFMSKPELDWREIQLGSGRIGIEHFRDPNKINQLIESGEFGQLLNNPAIQQFMEREGMDEATFKGHLQQLAPSYEQAKLTSAAYPPGYGKQQEGLAQRGLTFRSAPSVPRGDRDLADVGKAPRFTETGDIDPGFFDETKVAPVVGTGFVRPTSGVELEGVKAKSFEEATANTNKILESYPELSGPEGNATPKQIWEGYNQIMSDLEQVSMPTIIPSDAQRNAWGKQIADGISEHSMVIRDKYGQSAAPSTVNDSGKGSVMNDLGYSVSDFKTALSDPGNNDITVSGFSAGDGTEPGQLILDIIDKSKKGAGKDKGRRVYISTHMTNQHLLTPVHNLYNTVSSGKGGFVSLGPDMESGQMIGVQVMPGTKQDPDGKWRYDPSVMLGPISIVPGTNEYNFIGEAYPVRYRDVVEDTFNKLRHSGKLGTDLIDLGPSSAVQ